MTIPVTLPGGNEREEQRLTQEIAELMAQANAADAADDEQFGDRHGDELPD